MAVEFKGVYDDEKLEKLKDAKQKFLDATAAFRESYSEKEEDYNFVAGHQYTEDELRALEDNNPPRPAYVWNMILPAINLVAGILRQNPVVVKAMPREETDQLLADVINDAMEFLDDKIGAETEEFEAAEDAAICGSGYVRVDVNVDPKRPTEIVIEEKNIPYYRVYRDPAGMRDDAKDWRYIFEEMWLSREDFKIAFPKYADKIDELMETGFTYADLEGILPLDNVLEDDLPLDDYSRPIDPDFYNRKDDLIRVVRMQYWDTFTRYYTAQDAQELTPEQAKVARKNGIELVEILDKKVKWLEFCGDEILFDDDSPIPYGGFSIVPIFWNKDKSSKGFVTHYGVTRPLKDPNREVNKRWSMALDSLVSQGQGVMAEIDAFVDIRQAEESWSDPRQITWVTKGALREGKIQEKPGLVFPQAAMQMEEMAQEAIKHISGLNPNLMGLQGSKGESGVVIKLRIQQGLTLLAKAFANFKRLKAELFKIKAAIVMKYMPEHQLRRILGNNDKYAFQDGNIIDQKRGFVAPIRALKDFEYNIKVEDSPGNITRSMAELAIFMEMMKAGFPVDPEQVIDKLDLTAGAKADWKKFIEEQKQQALQIQAAGAQAKSAVEQAKLQLKAAETQGKLQIEQQKIAQKDKELAIKAQIETDKTAQKDREAKMEAVVDMKAIDQRAKQAQEEIAIELSKLKFEQRMEALKRIQEFLQACVNIGSPVPQTGQRLGHANRSQYGTPPITGATVE